MKNIPLNPVRPIAHVKQLLADSAAEFGDSPPSCASPIPTPPIPR